MRDKLREAFSRQAASCAALGSPFMARLMQALPDLLLVSPRLFSLYDHWEGALGPEGASLPLRLAGGLHALVRAGKVPDLALCYPPMEMPGLDRALEQVLAEWDAWLCEWSASPPQTNEVGRSAVLIAAAAAVSEWSGCPIWLSELGASAGLNLNFDRYQLAVDGRTFGASSELKLQPDWSGPSPIAAPIRVVGRRGVDLDPLDPVRDGDRLMAYVWPDQPERLARLAKALRIAADCPVNLDAGDAAEWLEERLLQRVEGACHLVFHTVAFQYFPKVTQDRIRAAMAEAGARAHRNAPLAWFGMEADEQGNGAGLSLTLWPGNRRIRLGRAGFHGQWVHWQGLTP